jgi:DNA repair exonuclease SbcCD ATPase subunit
MNRLLVIGGAVLLASIDATAVAQVQRSGSDAGATRAMQQLQQVTADRDKALAEGEKLKKENEELKAQLKAAAGERDTLRRRNVATAAADTAQKEKDAENAAAQDKLRSQLQELVGRYREITQNLKDVETDRSSKAQLLTQSEQALKTCVDRNAKLYALNGEVLTRLEGQGLWTAIGGSEPFTRLKRTQLENLADQYRDGARDNLLPASPARP